MQSWKNKHISCMRREHRHIHVYIEKQPVTRVYAGFYKYRGLKMEIEGGGVFAGMLPRVHFKIF